MRTDIRVTRNGQLVAEEVNHKSTTRAMEDMRGHWQPGDHVTIRTHLARSYLVEVYTVTPEGKLRFKERITPRRKQ